MDIYRYFLCFMFYSFVGWLYESTYYTFRHKKPVNTGFLTGCICPIYGLGAILDIEILGGIENPWKLFFAGMLLTCTLEYIVSWVLEEVFGKRWWNYSTWAFNINGRVCLLGALAFGTMTVLLIKCLNPIVLSYINGLNNSLVHLMCAALLVMLFADIAVTLKNADKFESKLWFIETDS